MINASRQSQEETAGPSGAALNDHIAPVPRVSVQAFCETDQTSAAILAASQDRRLGKAHITIKAGGMPRAIETYHSQPTPNVIVLETKPGGAEGHVEVDDDRVQRQIARHAPGDVMRDGG
ncbi:MAG: hypothetical protein E6699_32765, partial [Bradyrhizobium sp.]|nr:hypothetical protein [Bradyrhizobium sp.]